MGSEGYQEPVQPTEPDESERVDDVEKAQYMARDEKGLRDDAVALRKQAENPALDSKMRDYILSRAETTDEHAEQSGEIAGDTFDIKKDEPGISGRDAFKQAISPEYAERKARDQEKLEEVKKVLGI